MPRARTIYRETYRAGAAKLQPEYVPVLKHLNTDKVCSRAELLAFGVVEQGEEHVQYYDIRCFIGPKPVASSKQSTKNQL